MSDDDWDGGGNDSDLDDCTKKPTASALVTMHKFHAQNSVKNKKHSQRQTTVKPSSTVKPSFICQIDNKLPSQIVLVNPSTVEPRRPSNDTFEIDEDFYLRVLHNGVLQCRWQLESLRTLREKQYLFEAISYEWSDDSRVLQTFVNEFTGEKNLGYDQNFYGNDIFGKEWRTTVDTAPTTYKQYLHKRTLKLI